MDMLAPVPMSRFVEPELEDNIFASITSQVQAEGIQTLNVKGIRCREDNIRINGHRHHRCVGSALKQIEITHVQAGILLRKFGIEMMGHRFPLCQFVIDDSPLYRRCAIFEVRKCFDGAAQVRLRGVDRDLSPIGARTEYTRNPNSARNILDNIN
jgi:hypothetical protein